MDEFLTMKKKEQSQKNSLLMAHASIGKATYRGNSLQLPGQMHLITNTLTSLDHQKMFASKVSTKILFMNGSILFRETLDKWHTNGQSTMLMEIVEPLDQLCAS